MATDTLIALATDDPVYTDTVSMTNINSLYPPSNLKTANPQEIARATSSASTITFVHGVACRPQILTIHNHNLVGATVTFAGLSVAIPARSADGQITNVFFDGRSVTVPSTTTHQLVITGASTSIAIGRVCMPTSVAPVRFQVDGRGGVKWEVDWPNTSERGYYYADLTYDRGVRLRSVEGETLRLADQQLLHAVQESCKGLNLGFAFIPDITVNDSWFSKAKSTTITWNQGTSGRKVMRTSFGIQEISMGLVP